MNDNCTSLRSEKPDSKVSMYLHSKSHEFATSQNPRPQLTSHILYMQGEVEAREHHGGDRHALPSLYRLVTCKTDDIHMLPFTGLVSMYDSRLEHACRTAGCEVHV
jgi:hypothetical protein